MTTETETRPYDRGRIGREDRNHPANRLERMRSVLDALAPFDGRFVSRLSAADKAIVRENIERMQDGLSVDSNVIGYSRTRKQVIDLSMLRAAIAVDAEEANAIEILDALPAMEPYREAYDRFLAAYTALCDAAKKEEVENRMVRRVVKVPSFRPTGHFV